MKVIIIKGLPASGKTTWAKQFIKDNPTWKRINKDDLRSMLDAGIWSKENETFIVELRDFIIQLALFNDLNIIIDDTNLNPDHEKRIRELAEFHNTHLLPIPEHTSVEIKDFTNVPLETCIERDKARPNSVGEKVIREQYEKFLKEGGEKK